MTDSARTTAAIEGTGWSAEAQDPAPEGTWIVGRDTGDTYTALYYDSRGVSWVYQMSFGDREWEMWREAPGFWRRFSGRLSEGGETITGAWKESPDGSSWEHDFDVTYPGSSNGTPCEGFSHVQGM